MTRASLVSFTAVALLLCGHCAHWSNPCPPARPVAPTPPPVARVPDDAATVAAVEKAGATLRACTTAGQYLLRREGKREMGEAELRGVQDALYKALPPHWGNLSMLTGCTCNGERPGEKHDVCIGLRVREGLVGPVVLARAMAAAAEAAGAAEAIVRVQVGQVVSLLLQKYDRSVPCPTTPRARNRSAIARAWRETPSLRTPRARR